MRKALVSGLLTLAIIGATVSGAGPAAADPTLSGTASAFGATATIAGTELIPPTPAAELAAPPFGDDVQETTIPIPAAPLAVNGTLIANAAVHQASDITSALEQAASAQAVAGPYNAQGVGQVEDLEVIIDGVGPGIPLVEADLVRGEAVAKCVGDAVQYSANSEVVNLVIGGEDPLSGPLNDLISQITAGINASPLVDLVSIAPNVVTVTATGASVDALVITVLQVVDPDAPLVQVRLGHAEVGAVACGAAAVVPQCSDTADNDGDGVIDADDPGCHTDGDPDNPDTYDPNDDDETDVPECRDGRDNDGDGKIDFPADPDCDNADDDDESPECSDDIDNDGDGKIDFPADPECDDAQDDSEAGLLARTGTAVPTAAAAGLGLAAMALLALRRRTSV